MKCRLPSPSLPVRRFDFWNYRRSMRVRRRRAKPTTSSPTRRVRRSVTREPGVRRRSGLCRTIQRNPDYDGAEPHECDRKTRPATLDVPISDGWISATRKFRKIAISRSSLGIFRSGFLRRLRVDEIYNFAAGRSRSEKLCRRLRKKV
jgi:hypothetical protein